MQRVATRWTWMGIVLVITGLFLLIFSGCQDDPKEDVTWVDLTFSSASSERIGTFALTALEVKNRHYLAPEDFLQLLEQVNNAARLAAESPGFRLDVEEETLSITYRKDGGYHMRFLLGPVSGTGFRVLEHSETGLDWRVRIPLGEAPFETQVVDRTLYLPLDLLPYRIFPGAITLLRRGPTDYQLFGNADLPLLMNPEVENRLLQGGPYGVERRLSVHVLQQVLAYALGAPSPEPFMDSVETDEEYYKALLALLPEGDSQATVRLHKGSMSTASPFMEARQNFLEGKGTKALSWKTEENRFVISASHFFELRQDYRQRTNHLAVAMANSQVEGVVLDLRGNPGGFLPNMVSLSDKILQQEFLWKGETSIQGTVVGDFAFRIRKIGEGRESLPLEVWVDADTGGSALALVWILRQQEGIRILGEEPRFKSAPSWTLVQLPDGTLVTFSDPLYRLKDEAGSYSTEIRFVEEE